MNLFKVRVEDGTTPNVYTAGEFRRFALTFELDGVAQSIEDSTIVLTMPAEDGSEFKFESEADEVEIEDDGTTPLVGKATLIIDSTRGRRAKRGRPVRFKAVVTNGDDEESIYWGEIDEIRSPY